MGKGFNNYMCKKFFHPASRDNLKRVWMAQQKDDAYKKKQDELRMQYEKEQDLYNNKALLSKESKDKLSVNFMYEPPPGAKKEREKEDHEPEYKFEWQRKYNAPREDYCKGDSEIQDQPFGILVRNVRCIKCRKWGHINTDKECPMYNQATVSQIATENSDAISLLRQMKEDGLKLKKTALEAQQHIDFPQFKGMVPATENQSDEIEKSEIKFLMDLSTKKKLKLLRQLEKLEKKGKSSKKLKKSKKKKKKKRKEGSDSESGSSSESDCGKGGKKRRGEEDEDGERRSKKEEKKWKEEGGGSKKETPKRNYRKRRSESSSSEEEKIEAKKLRKSQDKRRSRKSTHEGGRSHRKPSKKYRDR